MRAVDADEIVDIIAEVSSEKLVEHETTQYLYPHLSRFSLLELEFLVANSINLARFVSFILLLSRGFLVIFALYPCLLFYLHKHLPLLNLPLEFGLIIGHVSCRAASCFATKDRIKSFTIPIPIPVRKGHARNKKEKKMYDRIELHLKCEACKESQYHKSKKIVLEGFALIIIDIILIII